MLPPTLIILSGLPGCGKTTLALQLVQALRLPVLAIDDVVDAMPAHLKRHDDFFWEEMVSILVADNLAAALAYITAPGGPGGDVG